MRVALIAPPWIPVPPPAYGGTEMVVDALARGLAVTGHRVLLATTGDSTCPVDRTWIHEHARTAEMGDMTIELTHVLHAYEATGDADVVDDHTVAGPVLGLQRSTSPSSQPAADPSPRTRAGCTAHSMTGYRSWRSPTTTPRPPATCPSRRRAQGRVTQLVVDGQRIEGNLAPPAPAGATVRGRGADRVAA